MAKNIGFKESQKKDILPALQDLGYTTEEKGSGDEGVVIVKLGGKNSIRCKFMISLTETLQDGSIDYHYELDNVVINIEDADSFQYRFDSVVDVAHELSSIVKVSISNALNARLKLNFLSINGANPKILPEDAEIYHVRAGYVTEVGPIDMLNVNELSSSFEGLKNYIEPIINYSHPGKVKDDGKTTVNDDRWLDHDNAIALQQALAKSRGNKGKCIWCGAEWEIDKEEPFHYGDCTGHNSWGSIFRNRRMVRAKLLAAWSVLGGK